MEAGKGKKILFVKQKRYRILSGTFLYLAETVGFEPTCLSLDKTISSRSRYDHFDTSPYIKQLI